MSGTTRPTIRSGVSIGAGGLSESEVDARVVAVASGAQQQFLRVGSELFVPAAGGPTPGVVAVGTSDLTHFGFPNGSFIDCGCTLFMPARWDEGTFRARFVWLPNSVNTGYTTWVVYSCHIADGEVFPTRDLEDTVQDVAQGAVDKIHISNWTNPFTVTGAQVGDIIQFSFARSGAVDSYTGTALLLGVQLEWVSNVPNDNN